MKLVKPAFETPISPLAVDSYGPRLVHWAKNKVGIIAGPWQAYSLERLLMHDADGNLIVDTALFSTGRQNGKTIIVRLLIDWLFDEGHKLPAFAAYKEMLAAAHDAGQARVVYRGVAADMMKLYTPDYGSHQRKQAVRRTRITDYFGIEINGLLLDTATSQPGSARGISAGLIAWDEMLTQHSWAMWEALSPAQSAILNAIMLLTSTAGHAESVVLRALYERGVRIAAGAERPDYSFLMLWWCADDDEIGLDWEQLKKANPALDDGRLSRKRIEGEYAIMPRASWIRERLNRWVDEREEAPFSLEAWGACRLADPLTAMPDDTEYTLAVSVTADLTECTIAVAAPRSDGRVGVVIHRKLEGTPTKPVTGDRAVKEISAFAEKRKIKQIIYPAADALAPRFAADAALSGRPYVAVASAGIPPACADFAEAVGSGRLAHDDPFLDSQIAWAQRRFVGAEGAWRWAVSSSGGPVTAVMAATLASSAAARVPARVQIFFPGSESAGAEK